MEALARTSMGGSTTYRYMSSYGTHYRLYDDAAEAARQYASEMQATGMVLRRYWDDQQRQYDYEIIEEFEP